MKTIALTMLTALLALAAVFPCLGESLYVDNRETDKIFPERLNLRDEPNKGGGIIGLYYTGAEVQVLGAEEDYTHVEIGGMTGYMATEYLITAEEAAVRYGEDSGFGTCRAAKVELGGMWVASVGIRSGIETGAETVATLNDGDMVELVGIIGDDLAYVAAEKDGEKVHGYIPLDMLVDVAAHEALIVAGSQADTRTILYSAPNDKAEELMSIKNGAACLSVFGRKEGNWVKVRVGGVRGWVRYTQADNLKPIASSGGRSTVPYYPLMMQTREEALLYSIQGDRSSVHMTLGQDMEVEILAESGDYVYVRTKEGGAGAYDCGDYGYIALSSLTLAKSTGSLGVAQADDHDLPVLIMDAPQEDAEMLGALIPGAQVRITDFTQTDYVQVALSGVTGYVLKSQIRALGDGGTEPSERIPQRANVLEDVTLMDVPEGRAGRISAASGSRVYMLAVIGEHAYVQADAKCGFESDDPQMGFVRLSMLNAPASTTHLTAYVTKDKINMRETAGLNAEIVGRARLDERLRVADYGQEWTCVVTPEGKRGYVMTQYLIFE